MQVTLLGAPEVTDSPSALVKLTEVHPPCAPPLFQGRGLVGIEGAAPLPGLSLADKERPELPVSKTWKLSCSYRTHRAGLKTVGQMIRDPR